MTILSTDNTHLPGLGGQLLRGIFRPIEADLQAVERCLGRRLQAPYDATVRQVVGSLRRSPGKRLRPALVLLSNRAAGATHNGDPTSPWDPVPIAAAMELIHMASLVHDDFIDAAPVRHHRSSVNARWGGAVSVALGDYLCAATADAETATQECLRRFGLHLGIAFQILDDCKDLLSDQILLGKRPAQDVLAGDVTLPLLLLLQETGRDREASLSSNTADAEFLGWVRRAFPGSDAGARTEYQVRLHINRAKQELRSVAESEAKRSLGLLADFISDGVSKILGR